MKNIILLGPPASGKGTVASELKKQFPYKLVSASQIIKNKASDEDKRLMQDGKLLDDQKVSLWIKEEIKNSSPYILDGFPRTDGQRKLLDDYIENEIYIYLNIDGDVLIERIQNRITCPSCKSIYSKSSYDKKECEKCNTELVSRADDNLEVFQTRMEEYEKITLPMIKELSFKSNFFEFTNSESIQIVEMIKDIIHD